MAAAAASVQTAIGGRRRLEKKKKYFDDDDLCYDNAACLSRCSSCAGCRAATAFACACARPRDLNRRQSPPPPPPPPPPPATSADAPNNKKKRARKKFKREKARANSIGSRGSQKLRAKKARDEQKKKNLAHFVSRSRAICRLIGRRRRDKTSERRSRLHA